MSNVYRSLSGLTARRALGCCVVAMVLVASVVLLLPAGVATAQETSAVTIEVSLDRPDILIGDRAEVSARVTTIQDGREIPVNNAPLRFLIDGVEIRQVRTDVHGIATIKTARDEVAGEREIVVVFEGTRRLDPANATAELLIRPWTLYVETVPAIEGVVFSVGGTLFTTDAAGMAMLDIQQAGTFSVQFEEHISPDPEIMVEFDRWGPSGFSREMEFRAPSSRRLQAGMLISNQVSFAFFDPLGVEVAPERISSVTLRSNTGKRYVFDDVGPQWVHANMLAQRSQGTISSSSVSYGLQSVVIDGSNVVNESQQRFDVVTSTHWELDVLLFSANMQARDALFGFPVGSGFRLNFPDGQVVDVLADRNAAARVEALARGHYEMGVTGAPGVAPLAPVAMVRDQDVTFKVVTWFDMVFVVVAALAIAMGLLAIGRSKAFMRFHRRSRLHRLLPSSFSWLTVATALMIAVSVGFLVSSYSITAGSVTPVEARLAAAPATESRPAARQPAGSPQVEQARNDDSNAVAIASTGQVPAVASAANVAPRWLSRPGEPEVDRLFETFWTSNGGAVVLGAPLTGVFFDSSTGYVSQAFEYVLLEHHPRRQKVEDQIQLRLLGTIDARRQGLAGSDLSSLAVKPQSGDGAETCHHFEVTTTDVCGPILDYWMANGLDFGDRGVSYRESLALFGYPISERFVDPDSGWIVQYFQRARLEYLPDVPASIRHVPLGTDFFALPEGS